MSHINDLENSLFSVNQIIRYTVNLPVYVVEYIVKGEGTVRCYGKEYRINSGDVYILPKDKEHLYYSDKTNPWTKKWFNVTGKLCKKLFYAFFHCDFQRCHTAIFVELISTFIE